MEYLEFEEQLCEVLKKAGWIVSVKVDRQDTYIEWTELGKASHLDFVAEVNRLTDCSDPRRSELLRQFGIYHGFIEPTRIERITRPVGRLPDAFLLIVCSKSRDTAYSFFRARDAEMVYRTIDDADSVGNEVVIIDVAWLAQSNVGKSTPLGAKGYWTGVSASPGQIFTRDGSNQ